MPYTTAWKNFMLDSSVITHLSLHSSLPNDSGSNELSGGSPAYSRQPVTFSAASSGSKQISSPASFNVPAGTTVTHVGAWKDNIFAGYFDAADESFNGQGIYTVSAFSYDLNG